MACSLIAKGCTATTNTIAMAEDTTADNSVEESSSAESMGRRSL